MNSRSHLGDEDLRRLAELIDGVEVAMLATADPDNAIRCRPLLSLGVTADGILWFVVPTDGSVDGGIGNEPQVNVA